MPSPPAARVGDPVTHTSAMTGLLVGLGVGLLVGAAIVATGGAAAPLALAAGAATGGSLGGMAGKFLGGLSTSVKGAITAGSPNVRINGLPAAYCTSAATCSDHSGPVTVAQGSSTVGINGRPAARTGDKGSCAFAVGAGSPNVTIGGDPAACGPVGSEVPWQADAALLVLGLAGGGVSLALKGLSGAAIAARLGGSLAGGTAGGMGGNYVGGKIFGEGSTGQSVMAFGGSFVGGYYGYKGGAKLDAVPRLNPFHYRPVAEPNTLGMNGGNVRGQYVGPETEGSGLTARPSTGGGTSGSIIKAEGKHGDLSGNLDDGVQSHHLNQDAAFKPAIPRDEGAAVGIEGNAFTEPGTPHYEAHRSMEGFWNQYRKGGALEGEVPTNGEYSGALEQSLRDAGASEAEIARLSEAARQNRAAYGLTDADPVPRLPGRINQRRP